MNFQSIWSYINRKRKNKALYLLLKTPIHGGQYYELIELVNQKALQINDSIYFKREKDNSFDKHAISIYSKEQKKLGYIPKKHNLVIANLLDQNALITGTIISIDEDRYRPVFIAIYLHL